MKMCDIEDQRTLPRLEDGYLVSTSIAKAVQMELEILREIRDRHPYCLNLLEFLQSDTEDYLVFEWFKASHLMFRQGTYYSAVNVEEFGSSKLFGIRVLPALVAIQKILSAVRFLHSLGIVHFDLKPSSIFLRSFFHPDSLCPLEILQSGAWTDKYLQNQPENVEIHPDLVVGDFSSAVKLKDFRSDVQLGSLGFRAPEFERFGPHDGRKADIYGVGAILNCMVSGHPSQIASHVSGDLRNLLIGLLDPSSGDRWMDLRIETAIMDLSRSYAFKCGE